MRGRHTVVAAGTGLVLGLLALGPALAPGFTLSYDMVFVPRPAFTAATFGLTGMLPRHVPSDAVVTALAHVAPADLLQKAILLAIFVMACVSAAGLVPSQRLAPRLVAGVVYAWNPFVAERLLLGHWALLLGYAALPWVARAAARGGARRLLLALLPAAIGGFAALAVSGLVALTVTVFRGRPGLSRPGRPAPPSRENAAPAGCEGVGSAGLEGAASAGRGEAANRVAAASPRWPAPVVLIVAALPCLVTSLLRASAVPADPAGVAAFAARADTPFGALGSLLLLGGAWNAETVPPGYGAVLTSLGWLFVVVVALAAFAAGRRSAGLPGLGVTAVAGFVLAALGAAAPGLLRAAIGLWPGFAVLRDGQQYAAPLALVVALGAGLAADRLPGRPELAALAVLVPVVLLPGLGWGAGGRLHAVRYPDDWARARAVVRTEPGSVLALPWEAYRSYPWNGGRRVLDPLPRFLPDRVIVNDALRIGGGHGIGLAGEDPRARALDRPVRSGAPLTVPLGERGVRYVIVDAGTLAERAAVAARLPGAAQVVAGPDLVMYRLPAVTHEAERSSDWLVAIAGFITFVAFLYSMPVPSSSLLKRSLTRES